MNRLAVLCAGLPAIAGLAVLHLGLGSDVAWGRAVALALGDVAKGFAEVQFQQAALPRLVMALLVGGALGMAGSLMQQATQNRLVSPMTLGAASGAWLAMVIATLAAPSLAALHGEWVAMAGALAAVGLVLAITGLRGLMGVQAVLAGMAVSLLAGAIASVILIVKSPYFGHIFVWGAGDLTQSGWGNATWLMPRVVVALALSAFMLRVLALLRLGAGGAEARGLGLWPALAAIAAVALFLTALSVAAVGMIGFIGLVAPNLARILGARRPGFELLASLVLGAILLTGSDALVLAAQPMLRDMVPTGAATALLGAPALIWLLGRRSGQMRLPTPDAPYELPSGRSGLGLTGWIVIALLPLSLGVLAIVAAPGAQGWQIAWPEPLILSLRWPRTLAAAAAGAGMAVSGVVLQRLVRNPLASPDILGLSSGATFALVAAAVLTGGSIHRAGLFLAFLGSAAVLAALLMIGRRHSHAPALMALVGIALGAMLDALVKFALAGGSAQTFTIIGWLAGSTYRVGPGQAAGLAAVVLAGTGLALASGRVLTLLGCGDGLATGRGLSMAIARPAVLTLGGGLAASVTAMMGPVTFVGLLAPHLAVLLGGRRAMPQILASALIGAALMIGSDWLGRVLIHPLQLPAGAVAAAIGGAYFIALITRAHSRRVTGAAKFHARML